MLVCCAPFSKVICYHFFCCGRFMRSFAFVCSTTQRSGRCNSHATIETKCEKFTPIYSYDGDPERWTANTFSFVTFHNNNNFFSFFSLSLVVFGLEWRDAVQKMVIAVVRATENVKQKKHVHRCCIKRIFDEYLISTVVSQPLDVTKSESLIDSNLNTNSFSDNITIFSIWIWIRSDVWLRRFNSNKCKQWTVNSVDSEFPWH